MKDNFLTERNQMINNIAEKRYRKREAGNIIHEAIHNGESESIKKAFKLSPDVGGFGEIAKKPSLRKMAAEKVDQKVSCGKGRYNDWQTYAEAAEEVRNELRKVIEG